MKIGNLSRFFSKILASAALILAVQTASAGELVSQFALTIFGGVFQPFDQEDCSFVPYSPPELVGAKVYDDGTLRLQGPDGKGGQSFATYRLVDGFESDGAKVLAYVNTSTGDFVFLSLLEDESVEVLALSFAESGLLFIPFDVGDTRDARAREMEGGAIPEMRFSTLPAILSWLSSLLSQSGGKTAVMNDVSLSGKTLFTGTYTEYGCLMRMVQNPLNSGDQFIPSSPPALVEVTVREQQVVFSGKNNAAYDFLGELPIKSRTFRVYAIESGAEHVVVSPEGDVVSLTHIPNQLYAVIFYDKGDTRQARLDQIRKAPGRCPAPKFPDLDEVMAWSFAQPVKAVNPPPGGGGGSGGGGQCPTCFGKGTVKVADNPHGNPGPYYCADCGGSSYFYHHHTRCMQCGGTGRQ